MTRLDEISPCCRRKLPWMPLCASKRASGNNFHSGQTGHLALTRRAGKNGQTCLMSRHAAASGIFRSDRGCVADQPSGDSLPEYPTDACDTYVSRHTGKDPILILPDALRRPEGQAIISKTRSVAGRKLRKPIALQRPTDFAKCDAAAYCCNASIVFKSSSGQGGGLAAVSNRERRFAQDSRGRGRRNPAHGDSCSYRGRGLSRD